MIAAGVGFRRTASADEIVSLVEIAIARAELSEGTLHRLATIETLAALPAFAEASQRLAVKAVAIDDAALRAVGARVSTQSARSMMAHGVGSVAEAAALAAGGSDARLILTRISSASVTCALAQGEATS